MKKSQDRKANQQARKARRSHVRRLTPDSTIALTADQLAAANRQIEEFEANRKAHTIPGLKISLKLLKEAAALGDKWNLNRQLCPKAIGRILAGLFPVEMVIAHHHAWMKPVAEHRRLMIDMFDGVAFVDMPISFFNKVVAEHERRQAAA